MRLTRDQISATLDTATSIGGADVEVLLFGFIRFAVPLTCRLPRSVSSGPWA
jgi:hypothetical protein